MKITPFLLSAALFCAASAISQSSAGRSGSASVTLNQPSVGTSSGVGGYQTGRGYVVTAANPSSPMYQLRMATNRIETRTNQFLTTNAVFGTNGLPPSLTSGPPTRLFGPPR